ncbi:hypothetical protein Vadar_014526 [Vaccinium darrowii]|uniref:Uncharacterized protein n=1 Tax=Vaccinium darrowii TaxID=229202 RepID=A0ACB7ZDT7_9ERIC|nr:hypothetical protein Vadar_014526 [Vaccinium darrowii]
MGSEGFQQSNPKLCRNGCGFFGTAANMALCSKCYRDLRLKEEQAVSDKAHMDKLVDDLNLKIRVPSRPRVPSESAAAGGAAARVSQAAVAAKRCSSCNKKVGLVGFQCRCRATFCGDHRYPETHDCLFDFKAVGKDAIARDNPVVKADKVVRF